MIQKRKSPLLLRQKTRGKKTAKNTYLKDMEKFTREKNPRKLRTQKTWGKTPQKSYI